MINVQSELYLAFTARSSDRIAFLQWIIERCGLLKAVQVLDVGCGPGHMFRHYRELGWKVVALEPDPMYFSQAWETAVHHPNITVSQMDFNQIDFRDSFDLVVSINGPFSYVLSFQNRADALRRCLDALKPGGMLFLDVPNYHWVREHMQETDEQSTVIHGLEYRLSRRYQIDHKRSILSIRDEYTRSSVGGCDTRLNLSYDMHMSSCSELMDLFKDVGFRNVRTYPDYWSRRTGKASGKDILISGCRPRRPRRLRQRSAQEVQGIKQVRGKRF
jgi:SAM-dependent methyltransferase